MSYYDFDKTVNRKNTNCVKWDTVEEGVLPFGIADMDFELAPKIQEAIINRVHHGVFGYSLEDEELFTVIINWFEKTYHTELKKEWMVLLPGIVPAFYASSLLSKGEILTLIPNYNMLLKMPEKANVTLIKSPVKIENNQYKIDFEDMEKRVSDKTDQFLFCNPHNPLGKVYTRHELEELSAFCKKHHLIIVSDEIHSEIIFEGEHTTMISVDEYAKEHSITYMAPGKTYNIAGMPFAFAIIPNEKLRQQFKESNLLPEPVLLSQLAAKTAYRDCEDWKNEVVAYLKDNRDYMETELLKRFTKVKFIHMEATYLMWVDFSEYFEEPAKWIFEKAKVSFTDGKAYEGNGYVRINIATSRHYLQEALDRIETAMKEAGII